jgi:hypothetical protein
VLPLAMAMLRRALTCPQIWEQGFSHSLASGVDGCFRKSLASLPRRPFTDTTKRATAQQETIAPRSRRCQAELHQVRMIVLASRNDLNSTNVCGLAPKDTSAAVRSLSSLSAKEELVPFLQSTPMQD